MSLWSGIFAASECGLRSGYDALFTAERDTGLCFLREIRADRDGIQFPIQIDDVIVKFKIVAEEQIGFNARDDDEALW